MSVEFIKHHGVIIVEPLNFFICHQFFINRCSIDRAKRDGFEIVESTKFILVILLCNNQVFDTDAILVGSVQSWFV